jgi:glycosidase
MKVHLLTILLLAIGLAAAIVSCRPREAEKIVPLTSVVKHADWTRNMVLYEINVRQFSQEGTFSGVEKALPQLSELGVNVLWFMPIYPIGVKNRKGELGSYYSIKDYMDVNPEFGTMDEFKALVAKAHELGFHVILDWVGNHTSWDNHIAAEFPEWFEKDSTGSFVPPHGFDWTDVIQLDYTAMPLWDYMIGAMKFWVSEVGVDGYRCDFPGLVPEEFWFSATTELNAIKPVLMLAEDEAHSYLLERAFDMNYAWAHHHLMNAVASGKRRPAALDSLMQYEMKYYPPDSYRLRFLTNHDENSWNGTIDEKMGDAQKAFAAYLFTIPGVPLMYNGQEADLDKRLEFFVRDPIEWKETELREFYTRLIHLRTSHPALRHGVEGGTFETLKTNQKNVYAYRRVKDDDEVLVVLNFSKKPLNVMLKDSAVAGSFNDLFTGAKVELSESRAIQLDAWGFLVMTR